MPAHALRVSFDVRPEFESDTRFLERRKQLFEELSSVLGALDKHASNEAGGGEVYAVTDHTCRQLAGLLPRIRAHKIAHLSSARLYLAPADSSAGQWYVVSPGTFMDIAGGKAPVYDVRADRVKGGEQLRRYDAIPLVSEKFVAFVRDRKLTGIDFLWAPDKGKYAAAQWYTAFGTAFLGRGVDHPWFDPATRGAYLDRGYLLVQPTDPAWLIGVRTFGIAQLREGVATLRTDPPALAALLDELRRTPTRYSSALYAPPAVLRAFLPDTDFAYLRIAQPSDDNPVAYRTVHLCARASTRQALIDAKLAAPRDFDPIEVIDAPPPGVPVFDAPGAAPLPPVFADEVLATVRRALDKQRAKFDAKPKPASPVVSPPISKLVPRLKRVLKSQGQSAAGGATAKTLSAAAKATGIAIPGRWAELLKAVDGFVVDRSAALDGTAELRVIPAKNLKAEYDDARVMLGDDLPKAHLAVATSDIGDRVLLDTAKATADGDCPVLFVNHETGETEATWPAIGVFLAEALEVSKG